MLKHLKKITPDLLVTDIVFNNFRTAEVFTKYNIDFCNGTKMSLNAACGSQNLNESDILEELQQFNSAYQNAEQWPVDFMIDYLINVHHNYFKNNILLMHDCINKFIVSHSKKFPEIQQLSACVQKLNSKLTDLVNYESKSLFPYIKRIIYAYNNNETYGKLFIKTLRKLSVEDLEQYHVQINVFTSQIEHLTHNFSLPEDACATHAVMLQKLHEFLDYLKQHFSIEKKMLIPATLRMEKGLTEKYAEM
jgi:regulator of cell morphogenesis and NO signaling